VISQGGASAGFGCHHKNITATQNHFLSPRVDFYWGCGGRFTRSPSAKDIFDNELAFTAIKIKLHDEAYLASVLLYI
jgi:hypothetical protein